MLACALALILVAFAFDYISGVMVGVGATTRLAAVRGGAAGHMVHAWGLTVPAAAFVAPVRCLTIHFVALT